jgi:heme/copper-type cytochrome/quinol oxidase subunit 1
MLLRVYADSPEEFAAWVNKQKQTALQDFADNPAAAEGQAVFMHNACINCHTQVFNQLFTMHGTTMVFFVGMGILFGMGNYLVPLMIGARDMAFPRLNAFSFWATAFAGALLYFSILGASGLYAAGQAPDVGWFAYAPLTARVFSPGHSTDYWTLSLLLSGIGSIGTAVNFSRNRSLNEMPWDDDESTPSPRVAISRDG